MTDNLGSKKNRCRSMYVITISKLSVTFETAHDASYSVWACARACVFAHIYYMLNFKVKIRIGLRLK